MQNLERLQGDTTAHQESQRRTVKTSKIDTLIEIFSALRLKGRLAVQSVSHLHRRSTEFYPGFEDDSPERIARAQERQNNSEPFPDPYHEVRGTKWDPDPANGGLVALGGSRYKAKSK